MTDHVSSADGTRIAYDRLGEGPPIVLLAGIFCTRKTLRPLAEALARFERPATVISESPDEESSQAIRAILGA